MGRAADENPARGGADVSNSEYAQRAGSTDPPDGAHPLEYHPALSGTPQLYRVAERPRLGSSLLGSQTIRPSRRGVHSPIASRAVGQRDASQLDRSGIHSFVRGTDRRSARLGHALCRKVVNRCVGGRRRKCMLSFKNRQGQTASYR